MFATASPKLHFKDWGVRNSQHCGLVITINIRSRSFRLSVKAALILRSFVEAHLKRAHISTQTHVGYGSTPEHLWTQWVLVLPWQPERKTVLSLMSHLYTGSLWRRRMIPGPAEPSGFWGPYRNPPCTGKRTVTDRVAFCKNQSETSCQVALKKVFPGAAAPTVTWKWHLRATHPPRVDHRRCTRTVYGRWVSVRSLLSALTDPVSRVKSRRCWCCALRETSQRRCRTPAHQRWWSAGTGSIQIVHKMRSVMQLIRAKLPCRENLLWYIEVCL